MVEAAKALQSIFSYVELSGECANELEIDLFT